MATPFKIQLGNHKALINGSRWYSAEHYVLTNGCTIYTNASGRRWGGSYKNTGKVGLRNVLLFVILIDNEVLFYILEKGGSTRDTITTNICNELVWLQINNECVFKYKLTPTHLNLGRWADKKGPIDWSGEYS